MIELEWTVERCDRRSDGEAGAASADCVTFVELLATNTTPDARRVRIANLLDGEVWPPRRDGVPESGWDDGGFEGVVSAEETVALGYACPAEPATEPAAEPAELRWSERAAATPDESDADERVSADGSADAADVVRALGDPRPPSDAVPAPGAENASPETASLPDSVAEWMAAVEERAERAEALANASTLPAAAREVERVGSLDQVDALVARLESDAEALATMAERADALRDRVEERAADVPVDRFQRLA